MQLAHTVWYVSFVLYNLSIFLKRFIYYYTLCSPRCFCLLPYYFILMYVILLITYVFCTHGLYCSDSIYGRYKSTNTYMSFHFSTTTQDVFCILLQFSSILLSSVTIPSNSSPPSYSSHPAHYRPTVSLPFLSLSFQMASDLRFTSSSVIGPFSHSDLTILIFPSNESYDVSYPLTTIHLLYFPVYFILMYLSTAFVARG